MMPDASDLATGQGPRAFTLLVTTAILLILWMVPAPRIVLAQGTSRPILAQESANDARDPIDDDFLTPDERRALREELSTPVRRQIITYTIRPGDTLWSIARQFDLDVDTLRCPTRRSSVTRIASGMGSKSSSCRVGVHTTRSSLVTR